MLVSDCSMKEWVGGLTGRHEDAGDYHEFSDLTTRQTNQDENDTCAGEDWESESQVSDANREWIMSVGVVRLSWPEEQDGEEVGSRDEGYDQGKKQDSWLFCNGSGKHWIWRKFPLIDTEGHE